MMLPKRWLVLLSAFASGIVLFVSAIGWAVVSGVAVPDQDPTPAMVEYARFHHRIVDALMIGGSLILLMAIVALPVLLVKDFLASRRAM